MAVQRMIEDGEVVLVTFVEGPYAGIERTAIYLGYNEESEHCSLWMRTIVGSTEEFRVVHFPWRALSLTPTGHRVQVERVPPMWGTYAFRLNARAPIWWPWARTVFYWTASGYWRWEDDRSPGEGIFWHDSSLPGRARKRVEAVKEAMRNADLVSAVFGRIR